MSSNLAQITKIGGDLAPSRPMGLTPQNIDEALRMADIMAKASIVPKDYQGNPGNILVAIQWGQSLAFLRCKPCSLLPSSMAARLCGVMRLSPWCAGLDCWIPSMKK